MDYAVSYLTLILWFSIPFVRKLGAGLKHLLSGKQISSCLRLICLVVNDCGLGGTLVVVTKAKGNAFLELNDGYNCRHESPIDLLHRYFKQITSYILE